MSFFLGGRMVSGRSRPGGFPASPSRTGRPRYLKTLRRQPEEKQVSLLLGGLFSFSYSTIIVQWFGGRIWGKRGWLLCLDRLVCLSCIAFREPHPVQGGGGASNGRRRKGNSVRASHGLRELEESLLSVVIVLEVELTQKTVLPTTPFL